jgi:hypothetical protein
MAKHEDGAPIVLSKNEARAGVTGHHVRYVLAFGLLGSFIAFIGLVLYFGHRRLAQTVSELSSRMEPALVAPYAVLVALGIVAGVLLIGLWDMVAGRSANASQRVMRWRVVLQLIAICLVMAALYLSAR